MNSKNEALRTAGPNGPSSAGSREPVAIVGIGCRLPGADGPDAFWRLLCDGVDAVGEVPPERFDVDRYYDPRPRTRGRLITRWGGFLPDVDRFDSAFFGISPREATVLDPQQRLALEVAWEALEDAGEPLERLVAGSTGVYMAMITADYEHLQYRDPHILDVYAVAGSARSAVSGRISYTLGLRGPSLTVDTACSSSLLAIHLACQSLRSGENDAALAGGVNLVLTPEGSFGFSQAGMLSPEGRCKFASATGDGFVRSDGVGLVLLKPLSRAIEDGNRVYAVIRGGGANNDGDTSLMMTPSRVGQEEALRRAYDDAGVDASGTGYVEAHGTGTPVGDPVEIGALSTVLGQGRPEGSPCLVGSVKTNIGHTEGAAGAAGLIKAALAVHHRTVPASLHHAELNETIDWDSVGLSVPDDTVPWPEGYETVRAGVSSFGISGTNVHLVLEEAPAAAEIPEPPEDDGYRSHLLVLSGRGEEALRERAASVSKLLRSDDAPAPRDLCYTAARRRSHLENRLAVVGDSGVGLADALDAFVEGRAEPGISEGRFDGDRPPRVAFLFPGQGAQWVGMGRELWETEPVFRKCVEEAAAAIDRFAEGWSLLDVLVRADDAEAEALLERVDVVQPTLFAMQVALAALWRSWGVEPAAVVGQSMGEVAAARVAGALSMEDAARIICRRSAIARHHAQPGAMAVVALPFEETREALSPWEGRVSVAVNSGPRSTVISGDPDAVEEAIAELEERDVFCRLVKVDYASHCPHMDPLEEPLLEELEGLAPRPGDVPFHSTVMGGPVDGERLDTEYWWKNLRQPVLFSKTVAELAREGDWLFLEVSPHPLLTAPVVQTLEVEGCDPDSVVGSLRRDEPERATLIGTLGFLHTRGCAVEWGALYPAGGWVDLPRYPWQRETFWLEEPSAAARGRALGSANGDGTTHPLLGRHIRSPLRAATHFWASEVGAGQPAFLDGHRVEDTVVLPAAASLEMALAAVTELRGPEPIRLRRVRFKEPLFLDEGESVQVLTTLYREPGGDLRFEIFREERERWISLTDGWISDDEDDALGARADLRELDASLEAQDGEAHYRLMERRSLHYDGEFRGVRSLRREPGFAEVTLSGGFAGSGYRVHPAVLDSCFQALVAAIPAAENGDGALVTYLPAEIEALDFAGADVSGGTLLARGRIDDERLDRGGVRGRLRVSDESGETVVAIRGFEFRPLGAEDETGAALGDECFFRTPWREQARPDASEQAAEGAWLVIGEGELSDRLVTLLRDRGEDVTVAGPTGPEDGAAEDVARVDPREPAAFDELLKEIEERTGDGPGQVVMLQEPGVGLTDDLGPEALSSDLDRTAGGVLHLLQAIQRRGLDRWPRLWIVTRRAQRVDGSEPLELAASPLWGLARVLPYELPELRCTRIDLGAARVEEAEALLDEILHGPPMEEVALRDGRRWVHRMVQALPEADLGAGEPPRAVVRALAEGEAYRLTTTGPGVLGNLVPCVLERQPPGPGEVEIEIRSTALNFMNVLSAMGMYPGCPDGVGTLGLECAGVVSAVGPEVKGLSVGDEVISMAQDCMASHVMVDARLVTPKPRDLGWDDAAALPVAFATTLYALHDLARLAPGDRLLVHSATGGVGLAALQWAAEAGAEVFATAGTEEKRRMLHDLGVRAAFDSRSCDFADEILELTGGEGVDVVLNSLAGEAMERSLSLLRPYGRFLELGKRDIHSDRLVGLAPFKQSLSYFAIDLDRMQRERPEQLGDLLRRVVEAVEAGRIEAPPVEARDIGEVVEVFRTMASAQHVGKLVVRQRTEGVEVLAGGGRVSVRADATYLVTGGLGALGRAVAGKLVERGARSLALMGRSAPSEEAEEDLRDWRERGVSIEIVRADVSDRRALSEALDGIRRDLPPLRGVVHAAGLLQDRLAIHADLRSVRRVFAPKVLGSWNLHSLTAEDPLDFFVLFSSAAAMMGSPGQGSYAAANEFLDKLAIHRRSRGLPGTSIAWGPWSEIGLAARADRGRRLAVRGVASMTPEEGVAAFERILLGDVAPHIGVLRFDVARWSEFYPEARGLPILAEIRDRAETPAASEPQTVAALVDLARLAGLETSARRKALEEHLAETIASILRLSASRMDPKLPINKLGLDSLMAVEVKNKIQGDFGVTIPMSRFLKGINIERLSAEVLDGLEFPAVDPGATDPGGREGERPEA